MEYTITKLRFFFLFILIVTAGSIKAQVGINTTNPQSTLDINGSLSLREGNALVLTNGNNANINLGASTFSQYRVTGPTASFSISSFLAPNGGSDGHLLTVINTTSQQMTITHNDAGSTASRRINCPGNANLILSGNTTVTFQYNATLARWMVVNYADTKATSSAGPTIVSVKGTSDISTSSAVFSDMSGMTLTFTPNVSTVYVTFSASGAMGFSGSLPKGVWAMFQLINVTAGNRLEAGTVSMVTDFQYASGNGSATATA